MPGQHYDMPMTSVYAQRRARLAAQLGDGGVAIIPTAPELHRNRDTEYLYRHDSYFYYLTGFTEPNAWLVIEATGRSTLFCQPKDIEVVGCFSHRHHSYGSIPSYQNIIYRR